MAGIISGNELKGLNVSAGSPTLEELRLLHALSNVCSQYMPGRWEYVDYEGYTAGRYGIEILAEYGFVQHDPGFGGEWTTKAIIVREQHEITEGNYEKIKVAYLSDDGKLLSSIQRDESSHPVLPSTNMSHIHRDEQIKLACNACSFGVIHRTIALLVIALTILGLILSRFGWFTHSQ